MASVKCGFCKRHVAEDERLIELAVAIRWADEREPWQGEKSFCSFNCVASWAFDKALEHDDRAVVSPPPGHEPSNPIVDTQTDRIIR